MAEGAQITDSIELSCARCRLENFVTGEAELELWPGMLGPNSFFVQKIHCEDAAKQLTHYKQPRPRVLDRHARRSKVLAPDCLQNSQPNTSTCVRADLRYHCTEPIRPARAAVRDHSISEAQYFETSCVRTNERNDMTLGQ